MPTVADILREQGRQEATLQSTREAILEILEARFEVVPRSIVKRIEEIEALPLLKMLLKKGAVVDSLEQFKEVLEKLLE